MLCEDSNPLVRCNSLVALSTMERENLLTVFRIALRDESITVREAAVQALAKARQFSTVAEALSDESVFVREVAVEALAGSAESVALEPLVSALSDCDVKIAETAAAGLRTIDNTEAVPALIEMLGRNAWRARLAAVRALADAKDKRAEGSLVVTLGDANPEVRKEAAEALRQIGWSPSSAQDALRLGWATGDWTSLSAFGAEAVSGLIEMLKNTAGSEAGAIAYQLGKMGDVSAVPALLSYLSRLTDPADQFHATSIVKAIETIGDQRAVDGLIDAYSDASSTSVRAAIAKALGALGGEQAFQFLVQALDADDQVVSETAAEALGNIQYPKSLPRFRAGGCDLN